MSSQRKGILERVELSLKEGDYMSAIHLSQRVLSGHPKPLEDEYLKIKTAIIEMIYAEAMYKKITDAAYNHVDNGDRIAFSFIYTLYKLDFSVFGHATSTVANALVFFYERRNDYASVLLNCVELEAACRREERSQLAESLKDRIARNIQALHEKAIDDEENGDYRYAFNSYRALLNYALPKYEYYLGYLLNAVKSGKPEEAFNKISGDQAYKDYVYGDDKLAKIFIELAQAVALSNGHSKTLQ